MFMSVAQKTIQRQNFESTMSGRFYYYIDETEYNIDDVRDFFLEEFPGEDEFFSNMLKELD